MVYPELVRGTASIEVWIRPPMRFPCRGHAHHILRELDPKKTWL